MMVAHLTYLAVIFQIQDILDFDEAARHNQWKY